MKRGGKQIATTLIVVFLITFIAPLNAAAASIGEYELSSKGAVVMDFDTGIILFRHAENVRRVPASTIKILAVYVVFDAIKRGEISLDTVTKISSGTSEFSYDRTWSNVPLPEGSSVKIRELLDVVLVRSACAATVALGEALCGSEAALMTRMREKAASLGVEVRIYDSWGGSPNNSISPLGLATLTRGLIMDHPEVLNITSKRNVTFMGATYGTSNLLLGDYRGLDGFKTGYTDPAGYCFIGTAKRDGRRIITVTMGSTLQQRYPDTRAMLDYGFAVADSVIDEYNKVGKALPSTANLIINGDEMPLTAYLIDDAHFFKLRDVALLLSGTEKSFGVSWDAASGTGMIISGLPYISEGGELSPVSDARPYSPTNTKIYVNGILCEFEIYLIDDNNYFKLRDLAEIFDFSAIWIGETRTVIIDTSEGYSNAA